MEDYEVYQVGGRLWSLREFLRNDPRRKAYQRLDLLLASAALRHRQPTRHSPGPDINSDTEFIARILLGILQRGHSSIVSPQVESLLLTRKLLNNPELEPMLPVDEDNREIFLNQVLTSFVLSEPETSPDWSSVSDSEEELQFLRWHLAALLGRGIGLVEAQRPLSTMLQPDSVLQKRYADRRVDFALETPSGTKIVFEVDGKQHQGLGQSTQDAERDRALVQANWHVERVSTNRVRGQHLAFSPHLRQIVDNDWTLKRLKEQPEIDASVNDVEQLARKLTLTPHAISRVQLAILLAMLNGEVSLSNPQWSIGIVERDLPCGEMAVIDLLEQITQLGAIYGIDTPIAMKLVVIPAYLGSSFQNERSGTPLKRVSTRYVPPHVAYELLADIDVLVDVSVRSRPADVRYHEVFPIHPAQEVVPTYELRSAYRRAPEAFRPWPAPRSVPDPEAIDQPLLFFLRMLFRKPGFKRKQLDVLKRAFERKDVLGLLPTGGGKSLTFQLATLLSPGATVVVAPLKSLIDDQVDNLHRVGINRVGSIHSGMNAKAREHALQDIVSGYPRFIYVSPERFHSKTFREELIASPIRDSLAFVVIDEAHCVSEWGHDFRPAYLSVSNQARSLFRSAKSTPPIIALTATASSTVLVDILRELDFDLDDKEALVSVPSFDREELKFLPLIGPPEVKQQDLGRAIKLIASKFSLDDRGLLADPTNAGVVFCRYVNGEFGVMGVEGLLKRLGVAPPDKVQIYAGKQPDKWYGPIRWEDHKKQVQSAFKDNVFSALVATSSFGMGIDKQNIRYTVHYGIPQSLEALAQEAGRAGRDTHDAVCAIVYTPEHMTSNTDFLAPDIDIETARERYGKIRRDEQGDASRLMFLHMISYPGTEQETEDLERAFQTIIAVWDGRGIRESEQATVSLRHPWSGSESKRIEKSLYRLSVLGVISDYTIDYQAEMAVAQTVRVGLSRMENALYRFIWRYTTEENARQRLMEAQSSRDPDRPYSHVLRAICEFTYEVIEKSRRESIRRVVDYLNLYGRDGRVFSQALNRYLSQNTFTGRIADIVQHADFREWFRVLAEVKNHELAIQLVNAAERELESRPTHPGLHILVGLGNVRRDAISTRSIVQRLTTGLRYFENSYRKSPEEQLDLARRLMESIADVRRDRLDSVVSYLVRELSDDYIAIAAYQYVSSVELKRRCAVPWLRQARDSARSLRETAMEMPQ